MMPRHPLNGFKGIGRIPQRIPVEAAQRFKQHGPVKTSDGVGSGSRALQKGKALQHARAVDRQFPAGQGKLRVLSRNHSRTCRLTSLYSR